MTERGETFCAAMTPTVIHGRELGLVDLQGVLAKLFNGLLLGKAAGSNGRMAVEKASKVSEVHWWGCEGAAQ